MKTQSEDFKVAIEKLASPEKAAEQGKAMGDALAMAMPKAADRDETDKDRLKNVVRLDKGYAHEEVLKTFILYENSLQQYFQERLDGELKLLWEQYLKTGPGSALTGNETKIGNDPYMQSR